MDNFINFFYGKSESRADATVTGIIAGVIAGIILALIIFCTKKTNNKIVKFFVKIRASIKNKINNIIEKKKQRSEFRKFVEEYNKTKKIESKKYFWLESLNKLTRKQVQIKDKIIEDNFSKPHNMIKKSKEDLGRKIIPLAYFESDIADNDKKENLKN